VKLSVSLLRGPQLCAAQVLLSLSRVCPTDYKDTRYFEMRLIDEHRGRGRVPHVRHATVRNVGLPIISSHHLV
jgi:hypothetical protein